MQTYCAVSLVTSFVFVICSCTVVQVYDVYPVATCQQSDADIECITLLDILNERDKYFTSNLTLVFHKGEHILQDEAVSVLNINNLTLQGYSSSGTGPSSPVIKCDNFTLQGYTGSGSGVGGSGSGFGGSGSATGLSGSGSDLNSNGSGSVLPIPHVGSSLFFFNVSIRIISIHFSHCNIRLSHADVILQDSKFENGIAVSGGALAVHKSCVQFNGTNSFAGNRAEMYGGAIYADRSTVTFSGSTAFRANHAQIGGAVYCGNGTRLSFSGNGSFTKNTAKSLGGAVYALVSNTLSFIGNISFMSNKAEWFGGAVYAEVSNTLSFIGNCGFTSNTAELDGGAVHTSDSNSVRFNGNCSFTRNAAYMDGGAMYSWAGNTLSFDGNISFISNRVQFDGGAMYAGVSNTLSFNGKTRFINNTAKTLNGGAVHAWDNNTLNFNGNSSFISNTADFDGGAVHAGDNNTLDFNGTNSFISNKADFDGGAVYTGDSNILHFIGSSIFISNIAGGDGGGVYVRKSSLNLCGSCIFGHSEAARGGGFALVSNSLLYLSGTSSLLSNNARFGGGAIVQDSSIYSTENCTITGNTAMYGGGLFVQSSEITLQGAGLLSHNLATNLEGGYGGAIFAHSSIVEFQGSFDVINNLAEFGGGLAFFGVYHGAMIIKDGTNLTFEGNLAHRRGGAMFVEDDPFTFCTFDQAMQTHVEKLCFFQTREMSGVNCFESFDSYNDYQAKTIILKLENNTATMSGDIMYGGHLDSCVICCAHSKWKYTWGLETFQLYADSNIDVFSRISSDPYKVCICDYEHSRPNCDQRGVNHTVYPGQVLVISVVAVGQMNGTVPSVIRAVSDDLILTSEFKETQPAENNKECSQLQYPLFSTVTYASLKLYSDEPCSTSGYPLTFLIKFLPCPVGFTLSGQGACICDERLQEYTRNCIIENLTISRDNGDSFWVGVEGIDVLILHPHCPFDYCTDEPVYFSHNSTDMQCADGRSGILCGACQPGRGLALGSSRCLSDCSNSFLALLIAFAFAGVALVAFLFLCHLTVAEGTLSGLIFYANVLAVNQTVFFPSGERNLLTVFIAWLNLDLGLETCFFVSLNAYYSTWLQFAFPIYIWVMVGLIIVLADRSVQFAKIIGSTNPVAVLATLFLLSYTKLLRAIMAAFSFTTLDYPDGDSTYVWLYDGNVGYLDRHDGRHIGLFLFSLLFLLFVFIPYTLLFLCGQWIQRKLWWLSATKQLYLKFFLDAHYGPYKNRHRYWTGLLLLLRFLMLFVAAITNINNPQDPFSNLLVILVISSGLLLWSTVVQGFYKKWYHDFLEGSLLLNLTVLAGGTYQVRLSGGNQSVLVYTSVSIALVTFIGISFSAVVQRNKGKLQNRLHTVMCYQLIRNNHQNDEDCSVPTATPMMDVTYSVVEIDHNESGNVEHETEQTTSESTNQ